MPRKTIKKALWDALEDLSKEDFDKFRHHLLDRRAEPRVRRNRVEGKNFLEIVDVLVSTFSESGAVSVTLELLTTIGCNREAESLARDTQSSSQF
ncbi:apoptosis-associated speck-like protein containing a CARD [Halichoeres trimaculatus]|uniref:apoptosis-associated speck-like protein containing a CARD n=1 Tax=Halichoeres trimaculatus TaxID=147232 RepID=UPI003D9DE134